MARKLSSTLQATNIYCSSRRRPSLTALPTFDLPPTRSENIAPNTSHRPKGHEYEAPSPFASADLSPDSQCCLASNRWLSMNGAFFTEKIPLELLGTLLLATLGGLVGEVWYEQARDAEGSIVPLITKLYDYQLPAGTLGLHIELFLYASWHHLRPLQGQCVPAIIGPFSSPGGKVALLMEPISLTGWREASMSDSDETKEKVIAAYTMVHSRGILHNDVELRHILISNEGNVQIIDWQMAKSTQPNEDVGLNACTQADLDYEARKVKAILNYQGAYARELELAAPLYEMYIRGYPVGKTDPRLGWFPPDELDSMTNGDWTEPDVEYSGGRVTITPLLKHHYVGPSRVDTPRRPKCCSANSHTYKTEQNLGSTSTTTNVEYWTMSDATDSHTCDARQTNTSTNSDIGSSPLLHSTLEAAQLSTPMVVKEEPVPDEEEEGGEGEGEEHDGETEGDGDSDDECQYFIGGVRGGLRRVSLVNFLQAATGSHIVRLQLRASFGFYSCDTARWLSDEELEPLGWTQEPAPSGPLLPKFGPSRPSFALPPTFEQQAAQGPRQPKPLDRHTHWRLTPYAKLAKSRLNPTGSRPDLSSRRNTTLLGSEHFVKLDRSYLPPRTLRPFGAIVPGSTLKRCKVAPVAPVAPPPRTFSKATLQPMYPPPPFRKPLRPKRNMDGILFEERLARYSDSREMLQRWGADLDTIAEIISSTDKDAVLPELVTEWEEHLAPFQVLIKNCSNLVDRKSDIRPDSLDARLEHVQSVLPKLKEIKKMIRERSSPSVTGLKDDLSPDHQDDPLLDSAKTTSGTPRSSPPRPSKAQPSSGGEVALSGCPSTTCPDENIVAQTSSSTPSAISEPDTPRPELSLDVTDVIVAVPSSPVLSPPLVASDAPPSRKPRRRSAPYPESSSRRLRSADSLPESSSTSNADTKAGKPSKTILHSFARDLLNSWEPATNAPRTKRRVSRGQAPSPAIPASATPAATVTPQSRYGLRPRKRGADEVADVQLAGPSKRRRSS
ncbi:hypothetical protein FRC10_009606 [Ceratobasidium sp. 414]|nr:hypothetical protein FRC10_009606 [Ceratobasidium sp. 414]